MKKLRFVLISFAAIIFVAALLLFTRKMTIPFAYSSKAGGSWSVGMVMSDNPLDIDVNNITWHPYGKYIQHPSTGMFADPFVVEDNGKYYVFFEQMSGKRNSNWGNIGLLASKDLKYWEYKGLVIEEPFHMSWPNVFRYKGEWYMIPEIAASGEMRIYHATSFPYDWEVASVPDKFKNVHFADPMIYQKIDTTYMWVNIDNKLRLYYTANLLGEWTEHPMSPVHNTLQDCRPASTVYTYGGGTLFCTQDPKYGYGTGVNAWLLDSISNTYYADHKFAKNPVLWRNGSSYAKDGMHTLNFIKLSNGKYFCVTDGVRMHPATPWKWDWQNLPDFNF